MIGNRYLSAIGISVFFLVFMAGVGQSARMFPRRDLVVIRVELTDVTLEEGKYLYVYRVESNVSSRQKLNSFGISCVIPPLDIAESANWPNGWRAMKGSIRNSSFYSWYAREGFDLIPGQGAQGFRFHAMGLPGVTHMIGRGHITLSQLPGEEDEPEENPYDEKAGLMPGQDVLENSFKSFTVGPAILPETLDANAHLERLMSLKDESAELGWIKDPGTVTSLNQKLSNALDALKRGNRKACKNIMGAFLQDLDAQKDKHINSNAYYLLKVNAEYIANEALKPPWYWPF